MSEEELCWSSARELSDRLARREISAVELVEAHLTRIARLDGGVNAVPTLVWDVARERAAASDRRRAAGRPLGPLDGLPILHKDTHETAGIRTTHGSPLFAEHVPAVDELIITRLRAAGTVAMGKTNVPEFAAGSHTFNRVFGATHNPYRWGRSAGGSSGGAAAALACGFTPLAEGSDMGGSLRNPASFCNVVGLRPTPGRVPTHPNPLPWATLSVQGPMARTVQDVSLLLSAIAGPDPRCPIALSDPGSTFDVPLDADLPGLRVGWSPDFAGTVPVEPEVIAVIEAAGGVFERCGARVERACPDFDGADEVFRTLRAWQFHSAFGDLVERDPTCVKDSIAENVRAGARLRGSDVSRAERRRGQLFLRMHAFFERFDVLVLPVSQVPPFAGELEYPTVVAGHPQHDYLDWMRSAYLVSATGCPALSVPGGFTPAGLPVGVQLVGPPRAELRLLRIAHLFEQATGHGRRHPALAPRPES